MISKILYIVLINLLFIKVINAQDSLKHSKLTISVGSNAVLNKDEFQKPFTYKGNNISINSTYSHFKLKRNYQIELTYLTGTIQAVQQPRANNSMLFLNYDYYHNIISNKNRKLNISMGLGIHALLNKTNYLPNIEQPINYLSGGAFATVGAQLSYRLSERSSITLTTSVPITGMVYRPDFEINGKTHTHGTLPGQGLISTKLEYAYKLNSKFSLVVGYQYNYFTYKEPRPIAILSNGLYVGLRIRF